MLETIITSANKYLFSLADAASTSMGITSTLARIIILILASIILTMFIRTEKDLRFFGIAGIIFYIFYKFGGGI